MKPILSKFFLFSFFLLISSCANFYSGNSKYSELFMQGEFDKASKALANKKKAEKNKNRLLYFYNQGLVKHLSGQYELSNEYFEKAVLFYETESKKLGLQMLSALTNPNVMPYYGEPHEHLLVHYYKTLNYLQLKNYEAALIECRRLNIQQSVLNEMYQGKNKYNNDAFIHNLMGIIYQTAKDYNNAFIAYRNAYEAYAKYEELFSLPTPGQLKIDLVQAAYLAGLDSEVDYYGKMFDLKPYKLSPNAGDAIYLFHYGIAPFKSQWSINFIPVNQGGNMFFVNEEFGISIPVSKSDQEKKGFNDIQLLRIAFPKYNSRPSPAINPYIEINNSNVQYQLEAAEDIEKIAKQTLEDRFNAEIAKAVTRLAIKKASEIALKEESETAGSLLSIVNFASEQADTRSWNTLPQVIYYSRIIQPEGNYNIKLKSPKQGVLYEDEIYIKARQTKFVIHRKL